DWVEQGQVDAGPDGAPKELALALASPNPVRDQARFELALPRAAHARLALYDVMGRRVQTLVDADLPAGRSFASWDATSGSGGASVGAGLYWARLTVGGQTLQRRFTLLR